MLLAYFPCRQGHLERGRPAPPPGRWRAGAIVADAAGLPAFRIIAAGTLVAALDADQRGLTAFRALREPGRTRPLIGEQRVACRRHFPICRIRSLMLCRQK